MRLRLLTAGESHGPALLAILDGLPAGLPLTVEMINRDLARRQRGFGAGPRMKIEQDHVRILGGVLEGKSTGAPLGLFIENSDHQKWRGREVPPFTIPRPGHADLAGAIKYAYDDLRPALERASARETAARVAAGAVCRQLLAQFDIRVGGYVSAIGEVAANLEGMTFEERISRALENDVCCPDQDAAVAIQAAIRQAMSAGDTLGGIIEVVVLGVPAGLGSFVQWDQRLDARLGAALLSVPAIKGVEIGAAFENARLPGSKAHDPITLRDGELQRPSVRSGGLEGGVTSGQPLILRAAMKPIPTTLMPQASVDLARGESVQTRYERSDFCPTPRAVVILEAMVAFILADALLEKLGGDSLTEMQPRFQSLRKARLQDLSMADRPHLFWPAEDEE